ncbi:MAG: alpha amylase N-terminal ig-like domain-containing protein [Lachnospiraceae bacterium]|nr:alpha amylase N-terminal ig-like domain-containing protein [Lachnospiraceae bacterium]
MLDWKESVYSDGTKAFVSNPFPKMDDKIKVGIRLWEEAPVSYVLLRLKRDGLEFLIEMNEKENKNGLKYYECELEIHDKITQYHFYLVSQGVIYYYNQKGIFTVMPDETYDFKIIADYEQASWVKDAVFYEIFPDRFCRGNNSTIRVKEGEYSYFGHETKAVQNWQEEPKDFREAFCLDFYGGDLYGIQDKIAYFKELGVNALYVTPIFKASSVHRYDCVDYFQVDEHLGGDSALIELTEKLHKENMKLIVDISLNHTGMNHKWFNREAIFYSVAQGAYRSANAKEKEFYYMDEDKNYACYGNIPMMPKLNYGSKKLREIMYQGEDSVLKKWLREPYNIDGWRFDVAATTGQYQNDHFQHEIWREVYKQVKSTNPKAYLLAEDWNDAQEFLQGDQWDGIMNFVGCGRPIRDYVGQLDFRIARKDILKEVKPNNTSVALAERITNFYGKLPQAIQETQFNMLGCHDVSRLYNYENISFSHYKMANILMYMLPGCVCMYYGDEIGLEGRVNSTEGCRFPMNWNENYKENEYFQLHQRLNNLKRSSDAMKKGGFKILWKSDNVFACARFYKEELYIAITSMEKEDTKEVNIPIIFFGKQFSIPSSDIFGSEITVEKIESGQEVVKIAPGVSYLICASVNNRV